MNPTAMVPILARLAVAADEKLSTEQKKELVWLILFVFAIGITLLTIVMLLLRRWRQQVLALAKERKRLTAAIPDIWKEGGNRLIAKMSPFPKADGSDSHLDDENPAPDFDGDDDARHDDDDPPFTSDEDDDDAPNPRR